MRKFKLEKVGKYDNFLNLKVVENKPPSSKFPSVSDFLVPSPMPNSPQRNQRKSVYQNIYRGTYKVPQDTSDSSKPKVSYGLPADNCHTHLFLQG